MKYLDIILKNTKVIEAYEVVGEWELWVGNQQLGIKVKKDKNGDYVSETSHFYHGSKQAGPYISSRNSGETVEMALREAISQLLTFYDQNDEQAEWVKNEMY